MGRDTAARVGALGVAVGARSGDRGPTIGDMPNGERIAYYLGTIVALEHSRDPADQQRVHCAALKAGCLMPRPGHPEHPDAALLAAITWLEELGADPDPVFWDLVGGRPESHHQHDDGSHRPSGASRTPTDQGSVADAPRDELMWNYDA